MATGGTIPSNRTQKVTFYNTTGVIERDKNIYYAPRFSKLVGLTANTEVREAYLSGFTGVCSSSSDYSEIEISGWSPQDRTLVVKGNIDDFRLVTDEGLCLNYFILQRNVTKGESEETHYYGFFVTGVEQAGGSSVRITCEPDDFSNVFYLHNTHNLTAIDIAEDYEPFNEKLKNCYVNRQHYNRVAYVTRTITKRDHYEGNITSINEVSTGQSTSMNVTLTHEGTLVNESHYGVTPNNVTVTNVEYRVMFDTPNVIYTAYFTSGEFGFTSRITVHYSFDIEYEVTVTQLEPDNMKVFLNQEETFRFKYQYRDMKYPISIYDGNFTEEEIDIIESEYTFSNLSDNLRKKIIKSCISYIVVETKSPEILMPYLFQNTVGSSAYSLIYRAESGQLITGKKTRRSNPVIAYPFLQIPEVFKKYNIDEAFSIYIMAYGLHVREIVRAGRDNIEQLLYTLQHNAISDFIYSAYYVKDVNFPNSEINVNLQNSRVEFNCIVPNEQYPASTSTIVYPAKYDKGLYIAGIMNKPLGTEEITYSNSINVVYTNDNLTSITSQYGAIGFMVSGYDNNVFEIEVSETIPDLSLSYYEPVLEAEPYSFYSLSFLSGYEMTFNKNRYYEGLSSNIEIYHYVAVNGAIKEGYIPNYEVDLHKTKYFNEGLIFVNSSSLALVSDSYSSFYYQNKAQMKNQFAVASYQYDSDAWQKVFVTSPNQVGLRASKAGGWGALAETGSQIMGWIDDAIDYNQEKHVIEMNQKAKLADMGAKPDSFKQTGSDLIFDLNTNEYQPFLNHYTIDELSYNSIAKLFERTGYQVNLYDSLHTMDRVGWNFIKLNAFDFSTDTNIMITQENSIRKIFTEGVTLLHDKSYLTSGHNFEIILEEGGE